MSTLTYLIEGSFQHEDFVGHHVRPHLLLISSHTDEICVQGHLNPGDVQFMIAGRGILHAEMPQHTVGGKDPMGLQLWIDLPKEHKMGKSLLAPSLPILN